MVGRRNITFEYKESDSEEEGHHKPPEVRSDVRTRGLKLGTRAEGLGDTHYLVVTHGSITGAQISF